jgi:hypothetical protein
MKYHVIIFFCLLAAGCHSSVPLDAQGSSRDRPLSSRSAPSDGHPSDAPVEDSNRQESIAEHWTSEDWQVQLTRWPNAQPGSVAFILKCSEDGSEWPFRRLPTNDEPDADLGPTMKIAARDEVFEKDSFDIGIRMQVSSHGPQNIVIYHLPAIESVCVLRIDSDGRQSFPEWTLLRRRPSSVPIESVGGFEQRGRSQ